MRGLETLVQDFRYAVRGMLRIPIISAAAVLSLALGIGANLAIFALIDAVMLRSLPVRSPQELVQIGWSSKKWPERFVKTTSGRGVLMRGRNVRLPFSLDTYNLIRARSTTLSAVAGRMDLFSNTAVVVAQGRADAAKGNLVTGNFFDTLGVRPAAGRLFTDADDREGADPVVALSYSYWMRRFGADAAAIGTSMLINGASYTITGVTGPGFTGVVVGTESDLYIPLHCHPLLMAKEGLKANLLHTPEWWWVEILGRRKPGVSEAQARAELSALFRSSLRPIGSEAVKPEDYPQLVVGTPEDIRSGIRQQFSEPLVVLMAIVGCVLLIACANVANLLLTRAVARRKEMAMRHALGARPRRLFQQTMVESILLSALGGGLGLAIARWGTGVLVSLVSSETNPLSLDVRADARVLVFLAGLSVAVGVLFGAAPAIQSSRVDVNTLLKGSSGERRRFGFGKGLVVFQVAVSIALLVGAGLYVRTLWNLRHAGLGFNADNVLVFRLAPKRSGYDGERVLQLVERVSNSIENVPGVRAVSYSHLGLLNQLQTSGPMHVVGQNEDRSKPMVLGLYVSPAFFEAMQIPVIAGRGLSERDAEKAPRVGVVNESLAREYFGRGPAIGRQVTYFVDGYKTPMEIAGVVKDAKYRSVTAGMEPVLYLPYGQHVDSVQESFFEVRTSGDPRAQAGAIQELVHRIDPELPVFGITTQARLLDENLRDQRLLADLAAAFAALALFLAAIGLYGVISYSISRRTAEIGIRMALGADRRRVLGQVMGESLMLAGIGIVLGSALAWGGGRLVASQLYGLEPHDPATMTGAAGLILVVAFVASMIPARRASRIEPMTALRHE